MAGKIVKYRKRKGRRRYRRYNRYPTPSRNLGPLAVKLKTKMNYYEEFSLDPGVGGIPAYFILSLNGLYDPNVAGSGHQPRGFDQLLGVSGSTGFYDHAVVIHTKVTAWFTNNDTSSGMSMSMIVRDNSTPITDTTSIYENRYVKFKTLAASGSGNSNGMLQISVNPNKFLGRTSPLSDPDLKNYHTSNPTEQAYLHIHASPMSYATDTGNVNCKMRVEYTAICIEPKQPAES